MNDIYAETCTTHISGEGIAFVETLFETSHYGKAHQPRISAAERTAWVLRRAKVFAEGGYCQDDAGNGGSCHPYLPVFSQHFLYPVV